MVAETHDVVVVGAGQAGLCISHELSRLRREHIVLEQGKIGQSWRNRWDSFCLVLPNWTVRLAGKPYEGPDPDGFMPRDEFVRYLRAYADSFRAPVREGVTVKALRRDAGGRFLLETSGGSLAAREVVVASGGYQRPHRPTGVEQLPNTLSLMDVEQYTNPGAVPPGKVLVLGSGQSGCQIAEDLAIAGRTVYLSCGRASWLPRRIGGRDAMWWLADSPFMNMALADLPSPQARLNANPQFSGRNGGHDLNYRTLQKIGVNLLGHFIGVRNGQALFAPDLADLIEFGDARYRDACEIIRKSAVAKGLPPPEFPSPAPFFNAEDSPESLDLSGFGAVIISSGFRPDYLSWIEFPEAFDEMGFPIQKDGSSTMVAGLHFMGVHYQRRRASATLLGVGEDAKVLARNMATRKAQ